MRDIFFILFLGLAFFMALKRPFLLILLYCYVDIVSPQLLSYGPLSSLPVSQIVFFAAVGSWLVTDRKKGMRLDHLQIVLALLMLYCGISTIYAEFPVEAAGKWSWVWKALLWSIFLPLVLTTRLRIEALALTMVLSASALAITGGLKTAMGGSGYGSLQLLLDSNSGLFEGSIFSTVAIAIIPLILWLARHGTIFKPDRLVWAFALCLIFACLLIPVGTQARTGLVCAVLLFVLSLRDNKYKMRYIGGIAALGLIAVPLLPAAFAARMDTIGNYQADASASTRIAVWKWTWNHTLENPFGGGFEVYRGNELQVDKVIVRNVGGQVSSEIVPYTDRARAFHNSYFEMLGEQGFPGLALWLYIQFMCAIRMEKMRRRYKNSAPEDAWVRPLATALQGAQLVYLLGSMFVGIAFQPFIYMLLAMMISLHSYITRREAEARWRPLTIEVGGKVAGPRGVGVEGTPLAVPGGSEWRGA
ncbi:MAG: putative O-glycosylation ligase, exosortase A system-associated [Sphingopyxis sp.]|nr:putative O-glycosylation ligase, exosortase A system-associated [Sphingopyxis sp.]